MSALTEQDHWQQYGEQITAAVSWWQEQLQRQARYEREVEQHADDSDFDEDALAEELNLVDPNDKLDWQGVMVGFLSAQGVHIKDVYGVYYAVQNAVFGE